MPDGVDSGAEKPGPTPTRGDFVRHTDPYRPELLAHCYRMLGSVHDAEDLVQETFLRAWRFYDEFDGRASLRTWLYRIATNACLTALERRGRRALPSGLGGPGMDPDGRFAAALPEVTWLQPMPDLMVSPESDDPAAIVASREGMRLAMVAALQFLPPRQRAVLILRDVLGWRAAEVAELLETTTVAVNSVLQRARAQLEAVSPAMDDIAKFNPADPDQRALLDRYVAAFESADVDGLTELLREDAVWEMPPVPTWFIGRGAIVRLALVRCASFSGHGKLFATSANGQPAFGVYSPDDDGVMRAHSLQVLSIGDGRITGAVSFHDPDVFAMFGLPLALPSAVTAARR